MGGRIRSTSNRVQLGFCVVLLFLQLRALDCFASNHRELIVVDICLEMATLNLNDDDRACECQLCVLVCEYMF